MYIYFTVAVLPLVAHIASCEMASVDLAICRLEAGTNAPPKDIQQVKTTLKTTAVGASTSKVPSRAALGSQGHKTSTSHLSNQPETWGEHKERYEMLSKTPHFLTKLAKTLSLGYDPFFKKQYFEPFERRPRPITLVAFRKKGYTGRHTVKFSSRSNEVAEQQSPFNKISNFWQDTEMEP